jgi:hypothetical protein
MAGIMPPEPGKLNKALAILRYVPLGRELAELIWITVFIYRVANDTEGSPKQKPGT